MKRILLLLAVVGVFVTSLGQRRLVLVEEFTNTGCGPCATWSPMLDSAIYYRLGDCIAIKYHSGFPNRDDEFYIYDMLAHQAKVDFYQVTGVPATFINGQELADRSFAAMDNAISWCQQQPLNYELTVEKQLGNHHLTVAAHLTPLQDISNENLRLFVAVIEEHIESPTPYPNGETELNYTMRKMLTPVSGYLLSENLTSGTTYDYTGSWNIDFFDDERELGVVAFLQDIATREVLVTAYSGPDVEGDNQLALLNVFDTPDLICQADYSGKVILRNDGANAITKAILNVKVNDSVVQYPWTGNLNYLESDTMVFSNFHNFMLDSEGQNKVEVWFSDINGTTATSNMRQLQFSNAVQATYGVRLRIYTDKKPEETTWRLYDSQGNIVRQGGPYDEPRKFILEDFDLHRDDCYQLEFLDAGGDGIKGAYGNGYYQLFQLDAEGKTTRITQGDYTGAVHLVNFSLSGTPASTRQRLVLFEEFTNTSCDPCADFSPALDQTIYGRLGDMVAITYHWDYPSLYDPFYLTNPNDVLSRANFYGITGVPSLFVDGVKAGAWGYEEYLDYYIDHELQEEPLVELSATATLSTSNDLSIHVSALPLASVPDHELRLFAAVVEERIEWSEPAANGERSWNYVMRKLLPDAQGQLLPSESSQVIPYEYDFSWPVSGFTNAEELGIITFVQDMTTKNILGAAYTPRPTGNDRALKILKVTNTPNRICTPQFTADLMVRNTGSETLTSATINISINGQEQHTTWTGELEPLGITTMRIPSFDDFALADGPTNDVDIWLSHLNGDALATSSHQHLTIANAYKANHSVRLTIMTDQKPEETTWTLLNSAGDVVCQGGPYEDARKKMVVDLPLDTDDCYMLEFEDAGCDGITGDYGRGYYMLHEVSAEGKARLLVQDTYTDALHDIFFSLTNASHLGIDQPTDHMQQHSKAYDLQGRPAHNGSHIIIYEDKKIINK